MAKLVKYGFIHDKAAANAFLKSSGIKSKPDAGADMFYFQFDGAIDGSVMIDVDIDGHTYSMSGSLGVKTHGCYGCIGTSKDSTSFDFVDKQPVAEASEPWPVIKEQATAATMTVSTFTGGIETYPSQLTQVNGADDKPIKAVSLSLDTKNNIEKEIKMSEIPKEKAIGGCPFDSLTAKAVHGNKVILAVTDKEGDLVGVAGQQGLTWTIEAETSESPTKDGEGGWIQQFAGSKSWNASTDGLYCFDDPGRKKIITALKEGDVLCAIMFRREKTEEGKHKYTPIRKGLVIRRTRRTAGRQHDLCASVQRHGRVLAV